ncbi:0fc0bb6a-0067-40f1-87e2-96e60f5d977e [Sclerotinia trifoliorum]|uniref:0fc0bb6a-0067-40f1-87e2-96e60f5d977e n=1 Tax=Sclerotinia trifoliorum TaxID=28548 RepID=A0A8H2VMK7_9HELO|nr:0fc0bb6a-0067-40f1-87e2-96e60f5d977e [Sclerotinia trifoliorum]
MSNSTHSKTTGDSFVMSPRIAPSESSGTTAESSSIYADNQAAIERWAFSRARTEKEHAAFREQILFQSADFHQFLSDSAKSSPEIAVPSPTWEKIPFPVPVRTPTIVDDTENQHLEMNNSLNEIQEVPRRRATPIDFGSQLQQRPRGLAVQNLPFDRDSFDGGIGAFEMRSILHSDHDAQSTNRETMIRVGAVFEVSGGSRDLCSSSLTRASDMATNSSFVHYNTDVGELDSLTKDEATRAILPQERNEKRTCMSIPFEWIGRQVGRFF